MRLGLTGFSPIGEVDPESELASSWICTTRACSRASCFSSFPSDASRLLPFLPLTFCVTPSVGTAVTVKGGKGFLGQWPGSGA